jgi:hypothetical protein
LTGTTSTLRTLPVVIVTVTGAWLQGRAALGCFRATLTGMVEVPEEFVVATLPTDAITPGVVAPSGSARFGRAGFDLRPQPLNARVHQPGVPQVVLFPHQVEQLLPGKHLPRRTGQDQQQPQLGGGQQHLAASPPHDQRTAVDHQLAVGFCRRADPGHSAQHRPDPRIEHPRLHRFHHVIVGPGLQAHHDVKVIAAGGQHDHRNVVVAPQPPADLETVHAWQHHIEHDDVHRGLADAIQCRLTGFGEAYAIAEAAQCQLQALPGSRIILN